MNEHTDIAQQASLISSLDVDGTTVFSREKTEIGTVDHLMIDRESGKIAYAVMAFGGFLGLGEDHHPIPWGSLRYDVGLKGYVTDISEDLVKSAPERSDSWVADREWERRTHDHYTVPYYWI